MSVLSRSDLPGAAGGVADAPGAQAQQVASERVALKDDRLVYRACSMAFAQAIGRASPEQVIGLSDVELFPAAVARAQRALDSRVLFTRQADVGSLDLGDGDGSRVAMVVRAPVLAPDGSARGIDLRLLGGPATVPMRAATTVDHETLVDEGLQGSLIFGEHDILFANARAAGAFGMGSGDELAGRVELSDLFTETERARLERAATRVLQGDAGESGGAVAATAEAPRETIARYVARRRDGTRLELLGRVTPVQWGSRCVTLLSFIDAALLPAPPITLRDLSSSAPSRAVGSSGRDALAASPSGEVRAGATGTLPDADPQALRVRNRELAAAASRYRQYARAAADFFWELDADLAFRRVSPDLERVLGVPAVHLTGRSHRQLGEHPANVTDPARWRQHVDTVAERLPFRDVELLWTVAGETRVIRMSGIPVFDATRMFTGYRGIGCDVTAANRQAQATAFHANHDALTGLANRRHFEELVGDALEATSRERTRHVLCYMDLDNFKPVNDTCGHAAGDELLRQLARLFDDLVRKSDVLARLGGDEFGIFLYNCEAAQALKLANQIRHEVENFQFLWEDTAFQIGVSMGLVVVDDRWESVESLFSAADAACYIAKNEGRNRVSFYREGEGNASNRKIATAWVEEIGSALAEDRIVAARQEIRALTPDAEGARFEMLMRLRMPDGSLIAPSAFLPSAERYGLSIELDQRMLDLTLDWLSRDPGLLAELRHVSLNVSAASFTDDAFADHVLGRIAASGVPPARLCFELGETATIANLAKASAFMQRLSAVGCRFIIDDFGSGLSSFAWLRKLPVDFLKIDGLLVKGILDDATDRVTVRAIAEISKSMGKRTVAEFVETPDLFNAVRELGIDFAQGYHLGEPELIETLPA